MCVHTRTLSQRAPRPPRAPRQGGDAGGARPGGRAGAVVVGAARAVAKGLMRGGEPPALQCCVMSVCLVRCVCLMRKPWVRARLTRRGVPCPSLADAQPWDVLAADVLFKPVFS